MNRTDTLDSNKVVYLQVLDQAVIHRLGYYVIVKLWSPGIYHG